METKEILLKLRNKAGLSQEELAEKVYVTRQAVSRWETGETLPNTETLKQLSRLYNVSINTLLGSPRKLICQCCGMPLEDEIMSKEKDGSINEDYCKWCYKDGNFTYNDMESLISFCENTMSNETFSKQKVRDYMNNLLPKLKHWSAE
ncbi:MAG: zinc ribbon domain-containing protein [Solobacterium sp.]|nr:zinc ribbon domain-containing protein [Solobacterium sp.]